MKQQKLCRYLVVTFTWDYAASTWQKNVQHLLLEYNKTNILCFYKSKKTYVLIPEFVKQRLYYVINIILYYTIVYYTKLYIYMLLVIMSSC